MIRLSLLYMLIGKENQNKIEEYIKDNELITMNLEEFADLLILNKIKIPIDTEITHLIRTYFS